MALEYWATESILEGTLTGQIKAHAARLIDAHETSSFFFGIGGIGYIILLVSKSAALSYFAVYLAAA